MKLLRYILFPVVPIYFLATWLRNKFYDVGLFKSYEYATPIICVGNLSVGGTGKTPMIEYLIQLLKPDFKIATLSRGYKRASKGFVIADENATAKTIGDEPFQFYNKFPDVIVSVDVDRRNGISELMALKRPPQMILLDDAFQHRKVKASFNILLSSYDNLYVNDIVLPTGNLREHKSGAKRADVIVVTKCPTSISQADKEKILSSLDVETYQKVFFSSIRYSDLIISGLEAQPLDILMDKQFTLVTGIANPNPLVEFLKLKSFSFEHLNFDDHHDFSTKDIQDLKKKEWILTTEKDFMRLLPHFEGSRNIFFLPIEMAIDQKEEFDELIKSNL